MSHIAHLILCIILAQNRTESSSIHKTLEKSYSTRTNVMCEKIQLTFLSALHQSYNSIQLLHFA